MSIPHIYVYVGLNRDNYSPFSTIDTVTLWKLFARLHMLFLSGITIINSNLRFSKTIQGLVKGMCTEVYFLLMVWNVSLPIRGHFHLVFIPSQGYQDRSSG